MKNLETANQTANTDKARVNPNINMSYEDIAEKLGITVNEVKEAEASALKKMRHPRVGKAFKTYLGIGTIDDSSSF